MARGSKIVPVRFEPDALAKLEYAVERHNSNTRAEQLSVSEYIRRAVAEKIAHRDRSARRVVRRTSDGHGVTAGAAGDAGAGEM